MCYSGCSFPEPSTGFSFLGPSSYLCPMHHQTVRESWEEPERELQPSHPVLLLQSSSVTLLVSGMSAVLSPIQEGGYEEESPLNKQPKILQSPAYKISVGTHHLLKGSSLQCGPLNTRGAHMWEGAEQFRPGTLRAPRSSFRQRGRQATVRS